MWPVCVYALTLEVGGGHSAPFSDVLAVALTTETQLHSGWGNIRCGNLESDSPQRGLPHAASERAWPFA